MTRCLPPLANRSFRIFRSGSGILDGPVVGFLGVGFGVGLEHVGDFGVLRIVGVRAVEEGSQGDESSLDGLDGGPAGTECI